MRKNWTDVDYAWARKEYLLSKKTYEQEQSFSNFMSVLGFLFAVGFFLFGLFKIFTA